MTKTPLTTLAEIEKAIDDTLAPPVTLLPRLSDAALGLLAEAVQEKRSELLRFRDRYQTATAEIAPALDTLTGIYRILAMEVRERTVTRRRAADKAARHA